MKALAICTCTECRHYVAESNELGVTRDYCKAADSLISDWDADIPEWCPLPEMPEVA